MVLIGGLFGGLAVYYAIPTPPAWLFDSIAQIGVGLLIAFTIAVAAVRSRRGDRPEDHLAWLCVGAGVSLGTLIAIALSLGLAAYVEAGHGGFIARLGIGFVAAAVFVSGLMVALLPYFAFSWQQSD